MPDPYDEADPLALLMDEWTTISTWFWIFMAASGITILFHPWFGVLLAVAALGIPLTKLGSTLVIVVNELRKELRRSPATTRPPAAPQDPEPGVPESRVP